MRSYIELRMDSISAGRGSAILPKSIPNDISRVQIAILYCITGGHAFAAADDAIRKTGFFQVLQAFGRIDSAMPSVPAEGTDAEFGVDVLRELDAVNRFMAVLWMAAVIRPVLGSILSVQLCRSVSYLRCGEHREQCFGFFCQKKNPDIPAYHNPRCRNCLPDTSGGGRHQCCFLRWS